MCDSLDNQKKERLVKQDKNTKKKSDLTLMIMKKYKLRKCEKKLLCVITLIMRKRTFKKDENERKKEKLDNLGNDEKEHFRKYKKKGKKFMRDNTDSKKEKLK